MPAGQSSSRIVTLYFTLFSYPITKCDELLQPIPGILRPITQCDGLLEPFRAFRASITEYFTV
jgi:hypothetical protein